MAAMSKNDADRLVKLLGMTGSTHDGEVLSAARLAHRYVHDHGLVWSDVIMPAHSAALAPPLRQPPPERQPPAEPPPSQHVLADWPAQWRKARRLCLAQIDNPVLTPWERGFLANFRDWERPSARQLDALRGIAIKVVS